MTVLDFADAAAHRQHVRLIFDDDIPHGEVRIVGHTATYTGRPCGVYVHSQARVTPLGSACFANFPK